MKQPRKRTNGPGAGGQQVNITVDAHWALVLRQAAVADGVSVPDLLRPVVLAYLKRRLKNEDLAEAVIRIEKIQCARARQPANVTELPVTRRRHRRQSTKHAAQERP